jgi:DNA end-binding protein Ku
MAARAIWKAELCVGDLQVPVKLYSAIEEKSIHFRLLHKKDHAPVRQVMVNPESEEVVPREAVERGYITPEGDLVHVSGDELSELAPTTSRAINVQYFMPADIIDHRYYRRPYYLGPDGDEETYAALTSALRDSGKEGFARWVMRGKAYIGALRLFQGYPVLIALRHADEVVAL